MPTNRRRRQPDRRPDLTDLSIDLQRELETGRPYFGGFAGNLANFTEAWRIHGAAITVEFVGKHPGRRPFAFWFLGHGKERPIIHPAGIKENELAALRARTWGFLHTNLLQGPLDVWGPLQEPEPEYLKRQGLLAKGEYQAFKGASS
jgi:hypothetical protein